MSRRWLWLVGLVLIVVVSVALMFYLYVKFQEVPEESWLRSGTYVVYEQFFVWNGNSRTDYMVWNITRIWNGFADLNLSSHGVNVTDGIVQLTVGEASLTVDKATREVVSGSETVAYYVGERWPFWIETNVTIGSAVDIWYGVNTITRNESIYVLGQQRDCWVVEYNWMSGSMKRWFDRSTGIVLKIYNVLHRQGVTVVVTETAVMTNSDL